MQGQTSFCSHGVQVEGWHQALSQAVLHGSPVEEVAEGVQREDAEGVRQAQGTTDLGQNDEDAILQHR